MDRKIGGLTVRELIGFLLLILLLLTGLLSSWYIGRQQTALSHTLQDSAWLALSGQWENARKEAEEAAQTWQQHWGLRAALGEHTPLEEIDELFAQLKIYSAAGEKTDFAQTCAALSQRMETIANAHSLHWWNIL